MYQNVSTSLCTGVNFDWYKRWRWFVHGFFSLTRPSCRWPPIGCTPIGHGSSFPYFSKDCRGSSSLSQPNPFKPSLTRLGSHVCLLLRNGTTINVVNSVVGCFDFPVTMQWMLIRFRFLAHSELLWLLLSFFSVSQFQAGWERTSPVIPLVSYGGPF